MARPKARTRRTFGAVRKLPSGRYQAKYTGPDTRWYTAPHTFDAKEDAEGWLNAERRLLSMDMWTPPAQRETRNAAVSLTINEVVDQWIKTAGHLAESSRHLYQSIRRNRIAPYLSDVKLSDFTRGHAHVWVDDIRRDHGGRTKRNVDAYKLLHAALQAEVDRGTLDVNPCHVKGATQLPEQAEKTVPTLQQLQVIVAGMPEHMRAGTLVAAWCGLRPAEWQELRRHDIERHPQPPVDGVKLPDRVVLRIDRQAHRKGGQWNVTPPKGGKTRKVVLPDHLLPVLDEQLRKFAKSGRTGLLFPNADGAQLTRQKYYNAFKLRAQEAGCPGASPHSLRHFGGTAYAQAGATVRETMAMMGHRTPAVAMRYQHVAADRPVFLAGRLSELAGQPVAPKKTEDQDDNENGSKK